MSSRHFFFGFHDLATTLPQPQPPPTITTSTTIQKKKMDDLTCSICLDSFYDPRITPCSHVFCSSCLSSLPSPFCPLCRCPLPLSSFFPLAWDVSKELLKKKEKEEVVLCECCDDDDGTSRKVATFWCEDCHKVKDCPEYFCDSCEKVEHQTKISRKHHRIPLTEKPLLAPLCEQHHQELLFFCNTEEKSLCYRCLEDHLGHNVISIEKQAEKNREVLRDLIEKRSSLGREKVPFFEEKRRDIVEKEIRGLRKKLEEKEKEREELEGTIVVVRERENEHGERVNVLLGEVERMNTFDLVGKKGGEKVVRMRKRIREGMGELLEKKEKEGFKRLRAMEEKMEEEVEMGNKELTERWKDKRKVYDMERKEYEKVHKDSSLFHNHCINVALITSTSLQKDNRESPLDMIDFTTYPNFPMNRYQKLSDLRTTYAQQYGESESERNNPWRIRFWYWEKRENHTKRVCYPFRERDYDSPIGILWAMYKFKYFFPFLSPFLFLFLFSFPRTHPHPEYTANLFVIFNIFRFLSKYPRINCPPSSDQSTKPKHLF